MEAWKPAWILHLSPRTRWGRSLWRTCGVLGVWRLYPLAGRGIKSLGFYWTGQKKHKGEHAMRQNGDLV